MKVAEAAEEVLKAEEAKKDKLCQELNLLVQQSAHAQLERLEQLTQRMESLNRGFVQTAGGSQEVSGTTQEQGSSAHDKLAKNGTQSVGEISIFCSIFLIAAFSRLQ